MPTNWQGRCPYLAPAESAPNSARTAMAERRDEEVLMFWETTLMAAGWLLPRWGPTWKELLRVALGGRDDRHVPPLPTPGPVVTACEP
jgi:hypothetical protein